MLFLFYLNGSIYEHLLKVQNLKFLPVFKSFILHKGINFPFSKLFCRWNIKILSESTQIRTTSKIEFFENALDQCVCTKTKDFENSQKNLQKMEAALTVKSTKQTFFTLFLGTSKYTGILIFGVPFSS